MDCDILVGVFESTVLYRLHILTALDCCTVCLISVLTTVLHYCIVLCGSGHVDRSHYSSSSPPVFSMLPFWLRLLSLHCDLDCPLRLVGRGPGA